jgi:glycolate oxidase FAD binding subunit
VSEAQATLSPTNAEEVQQCVLAAASGEEPLEVLGSGSKSYYGRPVEAPRRLALAGLNGIVDYQPGELIVVVLPGTLLSELEAVLAEQGQRLAFEPPHWGMDATIGGVVACNLSGPRRVQAGAVRDHLLGFTAVTGRGELVHGGGRVVKNVTGYDLSKLMCGSFGTLAVLTELVLKALPAPETEQTVAVRGLDDAEGINLLIQAGRSYLGITGAAHLPPELRMPHPLLESVNKGKSATLMRLEGPEPSVRQGAEQLTRLANQLTLKRTEILEQVESEIVWRSIREVEPIVAGSDEVLWRFSLPPTKSAALPPALGISGLLRRFYDWGGGQLWCLLSQRTDAEEVHRRAHEAGGNARIVRGTTAGGMGTPVFPPLAPPNHHLHLQLKEAFDPNRVLNPGRMYSGI